MYDRFVGAFFTFNTSNGHGYRLPGTGYLKYYDKKQVRTAMIIILLVQLRLQKNHTRYFE